MKPSEQLAEIARKDLAFRDLIAQSDAAELRLSRLVEERKRLVGLAFAEGNDSDTQDLDNLIADAKLAVGDMQSEAEKAQAALAILEEQREALKPAIAKEQKADRESRIARALDRRDTAQAETLAHLNALVRPISELIGAHRALGKLGARPGWNHGDVLYKKLRDTLDGPYKVDWQRDRKRGHLLIADEVYFELSGAPIPAPAPAKPKLESHTIEVVSFNLPDAIEDPDPDLGWPEQRSTMAEWALAFAKRGWSVAPCVTDKHGDMVPRIEGGHLGHVAFTSDPKRIQQVWEDSPTAPVCFVAVGLRWIFTNGRIKKFIPIQYVGR